MSRPDTGAILAVRAAFPPYRHTQSELTAKVAELCGIGPAEQATLERLHAAAGVEHRHTVLPLSDYVDVSTLEAANDRYIDAALDLAETSLRDALAASTLAPAELALLIVTSVTGVAVPSLDARLIPRLGLRPDIRRLPIFGLGCVAGAAGLARLHDYLLAWPDHHAALVAVELCSLSWPTTRITTADLVVTGLFGDGAAALVAGAGRGPRIVATRSEVYPDSGDMLGWRLASDGFRIVLTAELADVVERHLAGTVTAFLAEHDLTVEDITAWVCHPGGPKVIDAVQNSLKLADAAVAPSRRSLAEIGNVSSVSVLDILGRTLDAPPPPGSLGLVIGLGPGVSAELVLLRW